METAATALTPLDSGEEVAVVEIAYAEECTGLGGQYILAREVDGFRSFWLGNHGCNFLALGLVGGAMTLKTSLTRFHARGSPGLRSAIEPGGCSTGLRAASSSAKAG